jgi:hypothetical protein
MAKIARYNLDVFNKITFDGFDFKLPEETVNIISELSLQVGSPTYVKTPVFQKRDNPLKIQQSININTTGLKKKRSKNTEVLNDDDWETLRTFQTTKIEQKVGLEAKFDIIRSYLNKLSDKSYIDFKNKIMETMEEIINEYENNEEILRFGTSIFEIASTNRFYSKLYADLYAELIANFDIMREVFYNSFDTFLEMFNHIEYIDPSVDYDKFCKINKDNEKRKALSAFFVNLMINKVISEEQIIMLLKNLLTQIHTFISIENKKNEVDELTENIAILYKKEIFENNKNNDCEVGGEKIPELITKIANSKTKDYLSLSNKSIFKFMDIIDM